MEFTKIETANERLARPRRLAPGAHRRAVRRFAARVCRRRRVTAGETAHNASCDRMTGADIANCTPRIFAATIFRLALRGA
jgi:hypothetical protein